jgi:arginyl-tRNA synthetase
MQRKAAAMGIDLNSDADLSLRDEEELRLVKLLAQYPRTVEAAATAHEPHRIPFYLYDLAAEFHSLYNRGNDDPGRRFLLEDNAALTRARLELGRGVQRVVKSGLALMGVEAAEEM